MFIAPDKGDAEQGKLLGLAPKELRACDPADTGRTTINMLFSSVA